MKTTTIKGLLSCLAVAFLFAAMLPLAVSADNATPQLTLSKTADRTTASLGDNITYTYIIANTGSDNITLLTLTDDKLGDISLPTSTLAVGENVTATASHVVIAADVPGPIKNTATITGTGANGDNVTATASVEVTIAYNATLKLEKTASPSSASPHQTITYNFVITNLGEVNLTGLTLFDNMLGGSIALSQTDLAPGENLTVSKSYTAAVSDLPGPLRNTATVEAKDSAGIVVSSTSECTVSLTLDKSLLTKAEILKLSGVPGKSILTAPGLQKLFNPKSQAAEHAGKKDKGKNNQEKNKGKNK